MCGAPQTNALTLNQARPTGNAWALAITVAMDPTWSEKWPERAGGIQVSTEAPMRLNALRTCHGDKYSELDDALDSGWNEAQGTGQTQCKACCQGLDSM